jgi:hypothetical protein
MKSGKTKIVIAILTVAIAVRIFFFIWGYIHLPVSADEAWVGLMSMHILKGEHPVVYWGQSYMGTQESYFDAPLIKLFGANAFSIRIYPFLFSLLFVWVIFRLASRIYGDDVGIITLLLLAVPVPYLSISSALIVPDNYVATCFWGTLGLLIAYDLIYGEDAKRTVMKSALLGFVLGFGFWLHILIASYIGVIVLFLFMKDKLLFIKKWFWGFVVGGIAGSFPLLAYNIKNGFATFRDVAQPTDLPHVLSNIKMFFIHTVQFLLGSKVMLYGDNPNCVEMPAVMTHAIGIISFGLVALVILMNIRKIWPVFHLSLKNADGTALLFVMAVAAIVVFARSSRTNSWAVRYVLPVMSVMPIFLACGLWKIRKISRIVFYSLIIFILFSQGWGNYLLAKAWKDPGVVSEQLDLPDTRPLRDFLKEQGITHCYANFWISMRMTYETKEEIICTMPYNERYINYEVPYINEVRKADNVAYIMHPKMGMAPAYFENALTMINCSYKKQTVGPFTVFFSFEPSPDVNRDKAHELTEVTRTGWHIESNYKKESCSLAVDGDVVTRWGSAHPQTPGMYFVVDLGKVFNIAEVRLSMGRFTLDFPRGYRVEISQDNAAWKIITDVPQTIGLFWQGSHPVIFPDDISFVFSPEKARYVRITQLGTDSVHDWSIAELHIFEKVLN